MHGHTILETQSPCKSGAALTVLPGAGIATFGGLLMQRSESRFICFVVMPLTSFACYVLAAKLSERYRRALERQEAGSGAR